MEIIKINYIHVGSCQHFLINKVIFKNKGAREVA